MKAIVLLAILAYTEALYPPPNYKSIVKPSYTYLQQANTKPEILNPVSQSKAPAELHNYLHTSSSTAATPSVPYRSSSQASSYPHSASSTEKSHSYPESSSSTLFIATPTPSLSTSYGYTVVKVTPSSPAPQLSAQHHSTHPPVETKYEYIIPSSSSTPTASTLQYETASHNALVSEYGAPHVQHTQTASTPEESYIISNAPTVPEHEVTCISQAQLHHGVSAISNPTSTTSFVAHLQQPQPTNPPVKFGYEYVIPNSPSVLAPFQGYGAPHHVSQISGLQQDALHINQEQSPVKTNYEYILSNLVANPAFPFGFVRPSQEISAVLSIDQGQGILNVHQSPALEYGAPHYVAQPQPSSPPIKFGYEYVIPNSPTVLTSVPQYSAPNQVPTVQHSVPNVGPQQPIPFSTVQSIYQYIIPNSASSTTASLPLPTAASGILHVSNLPCQENNIVQQPEISSVKTNYAYTISSSAPAGIAASQAPNIPSTAAEHDVDRVFGYEAPHTEHLQHSSPPLINNYEYTIPNSPAVAPISSQGVPQVFETSTLEPNTLKIESVTPTIKTNYEYIIPSSTSSPNSQVSVTTEYKIPQDSTPALKYDVLQPQLVNPTIKTDYEYVILQPASTPASSIPNQKISEAPALANVVSGETDAPIKLQIPLETTYEYSIPSETIPASPSLLYKSTVVPSDAVPMYHSEYGVPH